MQYKQGDNLPPIKAKTEYDLTDFVGDTRVTAYFNGRVVAKALNTDLTIKLDDGTAARLRKDAIGAGVRAYLHRTEEWVLITAINGIDATITRGEDDPGGTPTVPAAIGINDQITIVSLDNVPVTATLDPTDTTNKTALLTLSSADTMIIPGTYGLDVAFKDPSNRIFTIEIADGLTIVSDANRFGAS